MEVIKQNKQNLPVCLVHKSSLCTRNGFTLSEVLITIGIIGIIAAMTLPTVVQNYRNHVVETRLQKFYTTFNQAIMLAELQYGDKKDWYLDTGGVSLDEDGNPIDGTAKIDLWFSQYLSQFIVLKKKVDSKGRVLYYLPDGTSFQCGTAGNASLRDIAFYPGNPEKCTGADTDIVGVCMWKFQYLPNSKSWPYLYNKGLEPHKCCGWDGTEFTAKYDSVRGCYKIDAESKGFCTGLIQMNGWKIPKDYIYKVRY